jgi:hypothetical protein
MIVREAAHHVSPAQAIAAAWVFAGFITAKGARLGVELAWCTATGRQMRPCGCRHCHNGRLAADLSRATIRPAVRLAVPRPLPEEMVAA